jgi:hypothetical protein
MRTLGNCGFQSIGAITQGSGLRGRALSADGTVWADFTVSRINLRRGLRRFLRDGRLRRTEISLSFHTELNDGSYLESRAGAVRHPDLETFVAAAARAHMETLQVHLFEFHPVKPRVQQDLGDVLAAERRAQLQGLRCPPLSVDTLNALGVAPHLARLIAGPCADQRETLIST